MEEVVAVGWVVICSPLFWLWAPEGELVAAVFGLVVYAVKARHLDSRGKEQASLKSVLKRNNFGFAFQQVKNKYALHI